MRDKFRKAIKDNGQSFKWFHEKYIKNQIMYGNVRCKLTYSGFMLQINKYAPISLFVESAINSYIKSLEPTDNEKS